LTQTWNDCLRQCGKQLTAILIDYHSQNHQKLLSEIQTQIQQEFDDILTTYDHQIPKLTSKLTHTDSKIQALLKHTEEQIANYRKRGNNPQQDPFANKKHRNNDPKDNNISQQVQSAISKVLGNINPF